MKKHLISALRSERRRNYTMNASIVSAVFMIMIWAGLLTGFIMIGIKRCLHFLSPLQMPFVFLIVGLVVSVIIGTCISAAVASKIVRPVREVKKAMHRVEKGDFSQRLEVTGFNGEIDELIESYNKMAQELGGIEMFRENFMALPIMFTHTCESISALVVYCISCISMSKLMSLAVHCFSRRSMQFLICSSREKLVLSVMIC